ncbi:hypothetical protein AC1031_012144 [Aphanomyces cochlioides]|nr:hypothetical protein AC1031_012144 [Aphanomyces cochlioides]
MFDNVRCACANTESIILQFSLSKTTMAHPALKLTYFDMAGRAETARLALTIGGIPFQDDRIVREHWPALKQTLPYKQVPVLTVNGQVFAQSHAINRYVGILAGLYPTNNPLDGLRVDEICDFSEDMLLAFVPSFVEQDPDKRRVMREELAANKMPDMLSCLEARLASSKGSWVLDSISLADLSIYGTVSMLKSGHLDHIPTDLCDKYTKVTEIYEAVAKHPKVAAWNAAH